MRLRESPNTPFTLLYERFMNGMCCYTPIYSKLMSYLLHSTAPATIIYDNCCNLHNYCLNREPDFFKEAKFLVDRFHWSNHTGKDFNTAHNAELDVYLYVGCSSGYNLATYPQCAGINTQVVEQANSTLSRIKSSLAYMTPKHFMAHCKLYIWYRNRCKELRL